METFAEYILDEKKLVSKVEIIYYLAKKTGIHFDKSDILKTEIARQFIEYMKIEVSQNVTLTASLLCNCKKGDHAQTISKLHTYAIDGAEYLSELGFNKKFCKICEEVNRYSGSNPREKESDILELVNNFGGMLLNRPERIGLDPEEAIVLLEHRNLKDVYNRYIHTFIEYVNEMLQIKSNGNENPFKKLVKIYNETPDLKEFIKIVANSYIPETNQQVAKHREETTAELLGNSDHNPNRALFSVETTQKILKQIESQKVRQ